MTVLHHDWETRSAVDLKKGGSYVYAESPTTEVILGSYAIDDGPVGRWMVLEGEPMPQEFREAMLDPEVELGAHNAGFERIIESTAPMRPQAFLPQEVVRAIRPISRWNCTAARAAYMGLPRSLDGASRALGLTVQKDIEGAKLMLRMCKPRGLSASGQHLWHYDRASAERLGAYCDVDVEVERALDRQLPELIAKERLAWSVNEAMNDRGVQVDPDLLVAMSFFVVDAELEVNARIHEATGGFIPKVSNHAKVKKWLNQQGFDVEGVGKQAVTQMLESPDLPDLVREVLLMRQEGGKSSASKYKAVLGRVNRDTRARGAIVYCGAGATHRYASRGIQLHNMPRGGTVKTIEQALDDVLNGASLEVIRARHGAPMVVASELVRPTFVAPPDFWLARGDYSQIEIRMNAWLAGEQKVLQAFRDYDTVVGHDDRGKPIRKGPDIYRVAAAGIAQVPIEQVTDAIRQQGKVGILACGFGGGVGAFQAMARVYNTKVSDERAQEIVSAWREDNAQICAFWRNLETAAKNCIRGAAGVRHDVRPGLWFVRGPKAMAMRLPSGNCLFYWYPRLEKQETPWGERLSITYSAEDLKTKQFTRQTSYGGHLCENAVQSAARDKMSASLVRLEQARLNPVLSVHDEGICQIAKRLFPEARTAAAAVGAEMTIDDGWHDGLPLAVDISAGQRYVKA